MRVLHVIPSVASSYGGPSAALIGLSRALSACGIYSETITTDLGCERIEESEYGRLVNTDGMNVRYFSRLFSQWFPRDFAWSPRLAHWLKENINNYDIVNIHGLFSYPNSVAARIAYRANIPYVVRPCGMIDPWCLRQSRYKKKVYLKLSDDSVLRNAAAISFTTQEEASVSYKVEGRPESFVIPLGIEMPEQSDAEAEEFDFPNDKKIVLFLSRLDPKKGLDILLPALACLKQVRDDFLAVIAGSGNAPYEEKIRSEVKSNGLEDAVRLIGFVEGRRKQYLLSKAACFVLPSYQENFGVSVAEAMAAGCPVIISNRVNLHKEVTNARAGLVVGCNVEELFAAINDLLNDEYVRAAMSTNGRNLVREKFDWNLIGREVSAMYSKCLGGRLSTASA